MAYKQNVGNGVSTAKDTATEADVRYLKTFHAGKGTKSRIGGILDCAIKHIIPGTKNHRITRGVYLNEDLVIDGDANLTSKNIKGGVSIFGVSGYENVLDTSEGNLKADSMLDGQKGFSKGKEVNGKMTTLSDASFSPSGSNAYNDCKITGSAQNNYVGAFDFSVTGYIAGKIRIHIANLLSGNIRYGIKVGGIGGYIEGTFKGLGDATTEHVLSGKKFSTVTLSNASGTMTNNGAVKATIKPGGKYAVKKGFHDGNGIITAEGMYVKSISAMAIRGFGAASGDWEPGPYEESFTMPANGTVYYSGMTASYNISGNAICEIYKNSTLLDHRDINSSNRYNWRGTMFKKSFSVAKGDVIKVKAAATSGSHTMANISAVIVYSV